MNKKWKFFSLALMAFCTLGILCGLPAFAQKYDFTNYGIEQGLAQSQVNSLCIDHRGFLWAGTLGGVSRFDGKSFTNYNYSNGLKHSTTQKIHLDRQHRLWVGVYDGLTYLKDQQFHEVRTPFKQPRTLMDIKESQSGSLFFLYGNRKLYVFHEGRDSIELTSPDSMIITAITTVADTIFASVYKRGLYKSVQGVWYLVYPFAPQDSLLYVSKLYMFKNGLHGLTADYSIKFNSSGYEEIVLPHKGQLFCMNELTDGSKVFGTSLGFEIANPSLIHYGKKEGLVDNFISDIIEDDQHTLWLASDGQGIFKFNSDTRKIFDESNGLHGNLIMSLAANASGEVYAGSMDKGLNVITDDGLKPLVIDKLPTRQNQVLSLLVDQKDHVWIGTVEAGLWWYDKKKFTRIGQQIKDFPLQFRSLSMHSDSTILAVGGRKVYSIRDQVPRHLAQIKSVISIYSHSPDTLYVGTNRGLTSYVFSKDTQTSVSIPPCDDLMIGQIKKWKEYLVLGTLENGLCLYHPSSGKHYVCNEKSGLSSNMVFSVYCDEEYIYAGTVNGVNQVFFNSSSKSFKINQLKAGQFQFGPECNQDAILKHLDGSLWVGTTKGIYIFDINKPSRHLSPSLYLESVYFINKDAHKNDFLFTGLYDSSIPDSIYTLLPTQNYLGFKINGVHLNAADELRYQYKLESIDQTFSEPQTNSTILFTRLSPGNYTFRARAFLASDSSKVSNEIRFQFIIEAPFYQKNWFRALALGVLLSTVYAMYRYRKNLKLKQQKILQEVRLQEQKIIQQRTSEDLHDELGNKITRLSLLTDVLQTKMNPTEDQSKLLAQIKDNIQGLYFGTKDIIWALTPNHHTLHDTLQRIQQYGVELFDSSSTRFVINEWPEGFKNQYPPFELSRNLIMICKEAFHNALKHAQASEVKMEITENNINGMDWLNIVISDDGIGYNDALIKKGNGLENIRKRMIRINGQVDVKSTPHLGTRIQLTIKIPHKEG